MKKKNGKSKAQTRRKKAEAFPLEFRERKFRDINLNPKHPDPIPGFVSTLPGPPGWQYKLNPGA